MTVKLRVRAAIWLAAVLLASGTAGDRARAESDWLQRAFPDKTAEQPSRRAAKRPLTRAQAPKARAETRVGVASRKGQDEGSRNAAARDPARVTTDDSGARPVEEPSRGSPGEASTRVGLGAAVPSAPTTTSSVTPPGETRPTVPAAAPVTAPSALLADDTVQSQKLRTGEAAVRDREASASATAAAPADATATEPAASRAPDKSSAVAVLAPPAPPTAQKAPGEAPARQPLARDAVAPSPAPQPLQPGETGGSAVAATASDARTAAVERGKQLWQVRRGPRGAALEECDLGLGKGRVVGTFAHLPRHFTDANRVMDLETRILWCAQSLQSIAARDLMQPRPVDHGATSELDDLAAYVASLSISWRLSPPAQHAKERQAVEVGRALYGRRQGPFDFACATCHGSADETGSASRPVAAGGRRAMTDWKGVGIPRLDKPEEARTVLAAIPFRGAASTETRTIQSRIARCFGYAGVEAPEPGSDAIVALVSYLAKLGEHGEITATRRNP